MAPAKRTYAVRLCALLTAALAWACPGHAADVTTLHGRTMGTTYNIRFWAEAPTASPPELQRNVDALLANFDRQMSTWRPDSEVARFNAAPANDWFAVSPDVVTLVERARELHKQTGGALDVTIGPVLRLWGFGAGARAAAASDRAPTPAALADAMKLVGSEKVELRHDPPSLRKSIDGLELDLSSLASGYAVDLLTDLLAAHHIDNAMIDIGGEMRAVGARPDGAPWRIGVKSPNASDAAVAHVLPLRDMALATSGDFQNKRTIDGVAFTHIVDPRTGHAIRFRGASVTVVAETCFAADGVSTALFVMGREEAYRWCTERGVAALFHELDEHGAVVSRRTPQFEAIFGAAATPTGASDDHGITAE